MIFSEINFKKKTSLDIASPSSENYSLILIPLLIYFLPKMVRKSSRKFNDRYRPKIVCVCEEMPELELIVVCI